MKRKPLPIYFMDTETIGFGGAAICATSVSMEGEAQAFTGLDCITECIDAMIDENPQADVIRIYFHNASFDVMRFKSQLENSVVSIQQNGVMFISGAVAYRNKILVIRDSMALLPSSLKKLSIAFCPELPKLDLDFGECGFDITDEYHLQYAKRDVDALRLILQRYSGLINVPVEKLAITAASQSFKLMRKSIDDNFGKYFPMSREMNTEFRQWYFGGRIYIRDNHSVDELNVAESLDITSSYPHQMRAYSYPIPGKSPKKSYGKIPAPAFKGRFLVSVKVVDYKAPLPILPVRVDNAPVYPHGTFESFISDHEYAILLTQKAHYKSLEIGQVYYWGCNDCDYIFKPYIDTAYQMKLEGDRLNKVAKGSGEAMRTVGKINVNSPYGKLAQRYLDEEDNEVIGWGEGFEDLSPFGKSSENNHNNDHRNVHLAAMITAAGRCQLYRAIMYYGVDNVIYADTDSVKVKKEVFDALPPYSEIGNDLGQWKNEGVYHDLRVIAPKVYVANVEEDGKFHKEVKSKGTPASGIIKLVCDGVVYPKEAFYDCMQSHRESLIVSYDEKPTRLKTFINTGVMAHKTIKSVTKPYMVKGMKFDEVTRCYHIVEVINP